MRFQRVFVDKSDLIAQMQARVAQCRRLASSVMDEKAAAALRQMADEGEATIAKLKAETVRD